MTTIERCPHPHAWPAIECTGVKVTRARRAPVCMCGHPKVVHEHWRPGLDCGKCDCLHYEAARGIARHSAAITWGVIILGCAAFWVAVIGGIAWPLIDAIRHH